MNFARSARFKQHPGWFVVSQATLAAIAVALMWPAWSSIFRQNGEQIRETLVMLVPVAFVILPAFIVHRAYRYYRKNHQRDRIGSAVAAISALVVVPVAAFLLKLLTTLWGIYRQGGLSE